MDMRRKLELLLNALGIPSDVPDYLAILKAAAKKHGISSGPEALVRIRNSLVHPNEKKRVWLKSINPIARFEAAELALTYTELVHLAVLGYKGRYARRMRDVWKGEEIARVPWA